MARAAACVTVIRMTERSSIPAYDRDEVHMRFRKLVVLAWVLTTPIAGARAEDDFFSGQDAFKRGDYTVAHRVWLELAGGGDAESQFRLARLYVEGKGVEPDDGVAVAWYRLAGAQGHARAQAALGFMLHSGRGVDRDIEEAIQWYRKAANQGRASARFNLGKVYLDGEGVDADAGEAARWFRMAADQGYAAAQTSLARLLEDGHGVERDPARAFKLRKIAAKDRDPEAEFQLARMYAEGIGTERDVKKALRFYERAAGQGHVNARVALELLYATPSPTETPSATPDETGATTPAVAPQPRADWTAQQRFEHGRALLFGDGVPRDVNRAEDWLRMAAEDGHAEAAYRLGLLLFRGKGDGGKAFASAYVWLARAAEGGIADAAAWRDRVYKQLNDRERAEVLRLLEP